MSSEVPTLERQIGSVLCRLRGSGGLSQLALANMMGTSEDLIRKVECGTRILTLAFFARMCEALDVPMWKVVKRAEEELRVKQQKALDVHPEYDTIR